MFSFRQRGRKGEREGEKYQCVVASCTPPAGDLAHNPGMCPEWELNRQPFSSQAGTQSTEPHQPGPEDIFFSLLLETGRERESQRCLDQRSFAPQLGIKPATQLCALTGNRTYSLLVMGLHVNQQATLTRATCDNFRDRPPNQLAQPSLACTSGLST